MQKCLKSLHSTRLILTLIATFLSTAFTTLSFADKLPTTPYLPLDLAKKAAEETLKQCEKDGYKITVTVVDRAGVVLVQLRNPFAGPHTINSSFGKAFASASLGQSTTTYANLIAKNPNIVGLRDMDDRMVLLGGGLPIVIDEQRVGGIGVGGAPGGHLDEACAAQGLQSIGG